MTVRVRRACPHAGRAVAVSHDEVEGGAGLAPVAVYWAAAVLQHLLTQVGTLLRLLLEQQLSELHSKHPPCVGTQKHTHIHRQTHTQTDKHTQTSTQKIGQQTMQKWSQQTFPQLIHTHTNILNTHTRGHRQGPTLTTRARRVLKQ